MGAGFTHALEGGGKGLAQGFQQGYAIGLQEKEMRQRSKEREQDVSFRQESFEATKKSDADRIAISKYQADTQRILADDQITSGEKQRQLEERRAAFQEEIGREQLGVAKKSLAETARSNKVGEKLGEMRLTEDRAGRDQAAYDRQQDRNAQVDLQNLRINAQRNESEADRVFRRQIATQENAARLLADSKGREFTREMRLMEMFYGDQAEFTKNMIGLSTQLAEGEASGVITSDQRASFLADALRLRDQLGPAVVGRLQIGDQQGAAREMEAFGSRFQDAVSRKRAEGMPESQAVAAAMAEVSKGQKPKGTLRSAGEDPYMKQARDLLGGGGGEGGTRGRVQAPPADLSEMGRRSEQAGLRDVGIMSQAIGAMKGDATPLDVVSEMNSISDGPKFMVDPKLMAPIEAPTDDLLSRHINERWVVGKSTRSRGTDGFVPGGTTVHMKSTSALLALHTAQLREALADGDEDLIRDITSWVDKYFQGRSFVGTDLVAQYIAAHAPSLLRKSQLTFKKRQ